MNISSVTRVVKRGRHRAKEFNAKIVDLTPEEWQEILNSFNNYCAYCGEKCTKLTQDHIIPLSRGGNHTASNVLPACDQCNNLKGNLYYTDFIKIRMEISQKMPGDTNEQHTKHTNVPGNTNGRYRRNGHCRSNDSKKLKRLKK